MDADDLATLPVVWGLLRRIWRDSRYTDLECLVRALRPEVRSAVLDAYRDDATMAGLQVLAVVKDAHETWQTEGRRNLA